MAGSTGLEPAASAVTGQRSNQLNYDPAFVNTGLAETRGTAGETTARSRSPASFDNCHRTKSIVTDQLRIRQIAHAKTRRTDQRLQQLLTGAQRSQISHYSLSIRTRHMGFSAWDRVEARHSSRSPLSQGRHLRIGCRRRARQTRRIDRPIRRWLGRQIRNRSSHQPAAAIQLAIAPARRVTRAAHGHILNNVFAARHVAATITHALRWSGGSRLCRLRMCARNNRK